MCVAFWLLDKHPAFWLILALNRDEFLARPTQPTHFWKDDDGVVKDAHILAGRDVLGGGTWMGITKTGRLAFLTNVRDREKLEQRGPECTSRGDLPVRFFKSDKTPVDYVDEIAREAENYNGFNLVVADMNDGEMAFLSNRHGGEGEGKPTAQKVAPGLHSLSNGTLDSRWPKMERGKKVFAELVANSSVSDAIPSEQIVEKLLRDGTRADDVSAQRAETSCSEDFEKALSSIFVETHLWNHQYGTRSMAVVGIRRDGNVSFFERYLEAGEWKDNSFHFQVEGRVHDA